LSITQAIRTIELGPMGKNNKKKGPAKGKK
jgi:hypothetical protein